MSRVLRQKISAVRARRRWVAAGTGLAMGGSALAGILTAAALADWLIDLPLDWRMTILAATSLLAAYCIVRHAVLPIVRGADDETLALAVERMVPAFASRLIAAIQFSRPGSLTAGESGSLVQAMVVQTEQIAAGVDFLPVIKADRLRRWASVAAALFAVTAGLFAYGGDTSRILLRRMFLEQVPLPVKTRVEVLSGSFLVAQGERATLSARAIGWRPGSGTAEIVYASGRRQTVVLDRSKEQRDVYTGGVDAVQEAFQYRIRLYDGVSDTYRVTAEARPAVLSLDCTQIYPKYAGLGEVQRQPTDLILLAGSRLRLSVQPSKPLKQSAAGQPPANRVQLSASEGTPSPRPIPLEPDANRSDRWSAEFALPDGVSGLAIHLTDEHGLESRNPPTYAIDLVPDRPPAIRITSPDRREVLVTTEATCTVGFVAADDYGLAALSLYYKVDEEAERTIPLSIQPGQREIRGYHPWLMSKIAPPSDKPSLEGCVIEFYLEARDANDVSGPGVTPSEHYQLRVVSKADKQAELIARMAESFTAIHDVSDKQEDAAGELGALITEQPAAAQPNLTQPKR